ncbi:MAG: 1-acyl-sn-glycerol-3-phosphate acyltransferase [Candidatus Thermoplasmatota archaeon]|jgi:1-acyl-sn-glycerol-3-phosphate acyltransferase|nr:1-acyl-sn-glycerol-3-phosphate acyltransferase [Candidatus Thermoplasmatota archaeon]
MQSPSGQDVKRTSAPYDPDVETSASSRRLNRKALLNKIRWRHDGRHPGSKIAWTVLRFMLRLSWYTQFRTREQSGYETIEEDRGLVALAWHTAGLVDPMAIVQSSRKRYIMVGRHDLMTRPILGRWARAIGSQPVLRQREIDEGTTDAEFAKHINERSLLTVAHTIAGGNGCVIMPEGTSQVEPRMMPLRSGPMRIALNAAAAAQSSGNKLPSIRPVGLHFRTAWEFRTDCYVEYGDEIQISDLVDESVVSSLVKGKWAEPSRDNVNELRNRIKNTLDIMTPDADNWEEFHSWSVISHIEKSSQNQPHKKWKDEVHGIRSVRDRIRSGDLPREIMEPAVRIEKEIRLKNLDPRSIDCLGIKRGKTSTPFKGIFGLFLMISMLPLSIMTLPQAILAWWLGNNSDEGLDARSTFHMMAVTFSPLVIWPFFTIPIGIWLSTSYFPDYVFVITPIIALFLMPLMHMANILFLLGYDAVCDVVDLFNRRQLRISKSAKSISEDISLILGLLK